MLKFLGCVAAGFAACKILEANAHGVPWELALKSPHRSVLLLRAELDSGNPNALAGLSGFTRAARRAAAPPARRANVVPFNPGSFNRGKRIR